MEYGRYFYFILLVSGLVLYFVIAVVKYRRNLRKSHLTFAERVRDWWNYFTEKSLVQNPSLDLLFPRKKLTLRERILRYIRPSIASYSEWKRFMKHYENIRLEPGYSYPILSGEHNGFRFQIERESCNVVYHVFFRESLNLDLVIARLSILKSLRHHGVVLNSADFFRSAQDIRVHVSSQIDFHNWLTEGKCEVLEQLFNRFSLVVLTDNVLEVTDSEDPNSTPDAEDFQLMLDAMEILQTRYKNTLPDMSPNSKIGAKPAPAKRIYPGPAIDNPQNAGKP